MPTLSTLAQHNGCRACLACRARAWWTVGDGWWQQETGEGHVQMHMCRWEVWGSRVVGEEKETAAGGVWKQGPLNSRIAQHVVAQHHSPTPLRQTARLEALPAFSILPAAHKGAAWHMHNQLHLTGGSLMCCCCCCCCRCLGPRAGDAYVTGLEAASACLSFLV